MNEILTASKGKTAEDVGLFSGAPRAALERDPTPIRACLSAS